jgi:hypothetical protein
MLRPDADSPTSPISRLGLILLAGWSAACGSRIVSGATPIPEPEDQSVETRLFLIGDAGAPNPEGEPVLQALGAELALDPARSLVLFLGDNLYPRGLPDSTASNYSDAIRRLDTQIDLVVQHGSRGFFIPGNHDWDRFGTDGWNAIRRQGDRIDAEGAGRIRMAPTGGCPGPVVADEGRWLRLVMLDTQWWLQAGPKPQAAASGCPTFDEVSTIDSLRAAITGAGGRRVVVLGHHPVRSGGEHGGFFDWKDHIFPLRLLQSWLWLPLPIIGSAYPLSRNLGITRQDFSNSNYKRMAGALSAVLREHPPLVYASGHDHGLQVIRGDSTPFLLVSGGGIYGHEGPLTGVKGAELALQAAGYMRLDILRDGRVRLGVMTVDRDGRRQEVQSRWLEPTPEDH